jgi:formylglycine-generating enzyme required for sulfatase activity
VRTALLAALCLAAISPFARLALAKPPPPTPDDDGAEDDDNPYASMSAAPAHVPAPPPRVTVPEKDGMLLLPGGQFTMGTADKTAPPNERPPHAATVAPFWIDRTEVTVGAYRACVAERACARPTRSSTQCTFDMDDPQLPVSCVTWRDADAYCRFAAKRLPRETEWEFAARGLHGTRYPWGLFPSCAYATTLLREGTGKTCSKGAPSRVGSHPLGASVWGVQDMSGNVEEWTADWYAEAFTGTSPRAGASHTLRGGGWLSAPSASRTTSRNWGSALEAGPNVGFRCARNDQLP